MSDHQAVPDSPSKGEEPSPVQPSLTEVRPGAGGFLQELVLRFSYSTGAVGVLFLLSCPVAFWLHGERGLTIAGLSAAVCIAGSAVSIVASLMFRAPEKVLNQVLVGMLARMAAPLAFLAAVYVRGDWMRDLTAGYLLLFYLVTLAVETKLVLRDVHEPVLPRTREELAAMPLLQVDDF